MKTKNPPANKSATQPGPAPVVHTHTYEILLKSGTSVRLVFPYACRPAPGESAPYKVGCSRPLSVEDVIEYIQARDKVLSDLQSQGIPLVSLRDSLDERFAEIQKVMASDKCFAA